MKSIAFTVTPTPAPEPDASWPRLYRSNRHGYLYLVELAPPLYPGIIEREEDKCVRLTPLSGTSPFRATMSIPLVALADYAQLPGGQTVTLTIQT